MQLFISSHQFSCQLTIHPPLLRSSPGFGPANEATTTLLCPDEVVAGFLCVCVAFWAEIAWSSLACNHDFYYLTVFRGHLDGFPTKMKVICFSVRTLFSDLPPTDFTFHPFLLSKIRLCEKFGPTPMNPSWDGQKTPRHIWTSAISVTFNQVFDI